MSSNDDTRPDEMTDTELDQLLAAANRELLSHIEATADPHRPLITIMTRGTQETYPSMTATPAVRRDPGLHPAAVMITMRVRVRDLVILLDGGHDLSLNGVPDDTRILARARALARVLVRDLKRAYPDDREPASALARALAHELVRDLDSDPDPDPDSAVSALALQLARALARTYSDNLDSVFSSAREVARALAHILDAQQVDASDADLSTLEIKHLDALDRVIWTRQTSWPALIADQVEPYSEQIRPGVYQIQFGNALAPV
jgi:hypothetical protein